MFIVLATISQPVGIIAIVCHSYIHFLSPTSRGSNPELPHNIAWLRDYRSKFPKNQSPVPPQPWCFLTQVFESSLAEKRAVPALCSALDFGPSLVVVGLPSGREKYHHRIILARKKRHELSCEFNTRRISIQYRGPS